MPQNDQILYQTERYHTDTFGYDIPVKEDGWYLLVLKFSEVYFNAPNMKVSESPFFPVLMILLKTFFFAPGLRRDPERRPDDRLRPRHLRPRGARRRAAATVAVARPLAAALVWLTLLG